MPILRWLSSRVLVLTLLITFQAKEAAAQFATLPDSICSVEKALAVANPEAAVSRRQLHRCGSEGRVMLARLVQLAATHPDTGYRRGLLSATQEPSSEVFRAAADLARNRSAPVPSRLTGLLVLIRQAFGPLSFLSAVPPGTSLENFRDDTSCRLIEAEGTNQIQGGSEEVRRVVKALVDDRNEPEPIRGLALCVMRHFRSKYQPAVDIGRIHISHVCDTRYRFRNDLTKHVRIEWRIPGTTAHGQVLVPAGTEVQDFTLVQGVAQFFYNDDLIASIPSSRTSCR